MTGSLGWMSAGLAADDSFAPAIWRGGLRPTPGMAIPARRARAADAGLDGGRYWPAPTRVVPPSQATPGLCRDDKAGAHSPGVLCVGMGSGRACPTRYPNDPV